MRVLYMALSELFLTGAGVALPAPCSAGARGRFEPAVSLG